MEPIDPRLARRPPPAAVQPAFTPPPAPAPARPVPAPAPVLDPPSFAELLEVSARGLVSPGEAYGELAARPEPGGADAALAFLAWGAAATAMTAAFAMIRLNAEAWGVLPLAAGGLAALILSVPLGYAGAAALHALGAVSGGQGGFGRSVEAAAVLGPAPALMAAGLWAPDPAWLALPALYATWLAVRAVERLHDAPLGQAWMVVGVCGAALAGSLVVSREKVTLALVRAENAATVLSNNAGGAPEERRSSLGLSAPLGAPSGRGGGENRLTGEAGAAGPLEADPADPAAEVMRSSLDLLRTAEARMEEGAAPGGGEVPADTAAQAAAMQQAGRNILGNLRKQLDKGGLQGVPPEQAEAIKKLLAQFEGNMAAGKGGPMMTPAETQRLLKQLMGTMGKGQGTALQAPPKPARRRPPPPPAD